jgi:tetratricopeptide (TPR) repeat protein
MPHRRNRRLLTTIDRFYSVSFAERSQVIESLALQDRTNAAYAAEAGAHRALEGLRIEDAIGYLELAVRYSEDQQQLRNLIQLGDAFFFGGSYKEAWQVYESALRSAKEDCRLRALCEQRLGRVASALGSFQEAKKFLEKARLNLDTEERFLSDCEHACVLASLKQVDEARQELERLQGEITGQATIQPERALHWLQKTKLQVSLIAQDPSRLRDLTSACASTFVFDNYEVSELADFVETIRFVQRAAPASVSTDLTIEANRTAMMLGKTRTDTKVSVPRVRAI